MKIRKPKILLVILAIALVPLACTVFVGGPDYPTTPIAVSTEAVGSLDQQLQAAETAAAQSGTLTITINETQITSLLAAKLDSQSDPFIRDPQVYLRDGEIQVYGRATQGNLQANVRIVLSATLDQAGKPVITVTSTDFGPFPAPQGLNSTVSSFIDQAFTGTLGPAVTGLRLESINIADGVMTLTGRVK
jgi:uncharacterized protein YpmS